MKKLIATALVGGLVMGALVAPATAAKKKKKPKVPVAVASETKFFMHWDDDGAGGCAGAQYLSIEDKEDPGSGCEFTALPAQEILIATGQGALSREWPATNGVPLVLDAARKITGEIVMRGSAGAGAKVEVVVTGMVDGAVVEIAKGETQTVNFAASGQTGPQVLKFELTPDAALTGKTLEGLTLTTTTRGVTGATYYDLEGPSFMVVPATIYQ